MKPIYLLFVFCLILIIFSNLSLPKKEEHHTTTTLKIENQEHIEIETRKNKIFIYADRFEPSNIEINKSEEVVWINKDEKEHVIIFSNPPLEKKVLANDYFIHQFYSTGSYEFSDKETGMKGKITVK